MTNEELVEKVKNSEPLADLELWKAVEKFVKKEARSYLCRAGRWTKVEHEDLVQVGFIAMLDAVEKYDSERGGSFIGSLSYALKNRFAEEGGHRSSKRDALMLSYSTDEPIKADDPEGDTLEEFVEDPQGEYAFCLVDYRDFVRYTRSLIYAALERLAPKQKEYIEKVYLMGMTLEDAAGDASKQSAYLSIQNGFRIMRRGKYRTQLREALQGFTDFDELRAGGYRIVELKAISRIK